MRTLKTLLIAAVLVGLCPVEVMAKPAARTQKVFVFAETMMRGQTRDESQVVDAMKLALNELLIKVDAGRLIVDTTDLSGLFMITGAEKCQPAETLAKCLARLPVETYLEAKLTGRILQVDRYQYREDGTYDSKRFEMILNYDDQEILKRQVKNMMLCHAYSRDFDANLVQQACGALETTTGFESWKSVTPAQPQVNGAVKTAQPAPVAPQKVSVQPAQKAKRFPLAMAVTIGTGVMAIPPLVIGVLGGIGAAAYAGLVMVVWQRLDGAAENKGLSPGSGYRSNLTARRNADLQGSVAIGVMCAMSAVLGVALLGIVGVVVLYNVL